MNRTTLILTLLAGVTTTLPAGAVDLARGRALHDSVCKTCHQADFYTRKNSIIHSLAELQAQVGRCQDGAGEHWSATQINDVAAWLNSRYYKFK